MIIIIIRLLLLLLYHYYYYYHHHVIIMSSIIRDHPVNSIINSDYLKKRKLANEEIIELIIITSITYVDTWRILLKDTQHVYQDVAEKKIYHATVAKSLKRLGLHAVLLHTSWSLES